jgi:tripartite-type tricarboxylate transporter receptor subunit TctC
VLIENKPGATGNVGTETQPGGMVLVSPDEIIDRLNKEVNAVLVDPKVKAQIADLGGTVMTGSPAEFGKFVADETEKWARVVKFSGAKPE